jgi:isocitrate/isopropylmalate dehydrogenase
MMIQWLGDIKTALRIEAAVQKTLEQGVRTPDLGGSSKTADVTDAVKGFLALSGD